MYPYIFLQEWTLAPENGGNIELTFIFVFDVEEDKNCSYDYVEVSHGNYSERFCGGSLRGSVITSSGTSIVVTFHTDSSVTGLGFQAKWREV